MNRAPMGVGEWYHCYTRGVDKRRTFQSVADYRRFQEILYLTNSDAPIHRSNLLKTSHVDVFSHPRGKALIEIGSYALMPNHFHILIYEIREGGITRFMQKIGTAYAMYFNIRNDRVGNLFVKPFRSKHIKDDEYLRYVAQYIHLNPIELFDARWKTASKKDITRIEKKLRQYEYSSLPEYCGQQRPERTILGSEALEVIGDGLPPLSEVLHEAAEYYQEIGLND